jgi:hypothetical protein
MNFFSGIQECISLKYFVFNISLLDQKENVELYLSTEKLYSGFEQNSRGNLRN